jgi:hypothetical protein
LLILVLPAACKASSVHSKKETKFFEPTLGGKETSSHPPVVFLDRPPRHDLKLLFLQLYLLKTTVFTTVDASRLCVVVFLVFERFPNKLLSNCPFCGITLLVLSCIFLILFFLFFFYLFYFLVCLFACRLSLSLSLSHHASHKLLWVVPRKIDLGIKPPKVTFILFLADSSQVRAVFSLKDIFKSTQEQDVAIYYLRIGLHSSTLLLKPCYETFDVDQLEILLYPAADEISCYRAFFLFFFLLLLLFFPGSPLKTVDFAFCRTTIV